MQAIDGITQGLLSVFWIIAGFAALVVIGFGLWVSLISGIDAVERRRRGKIPSPFGLIDPPTNRELRRSRKEHPSASGKEKG